MKVKEIMERCGMNETGRAIAYIKDALEELEMLSGENVHGGSRAYYKSNTFSVDLSTDITASAELDNVTTWSAASGATPPTDWTLYNTESGDSVTFAGGGTASLKIIAAADIDSLENAGIYQGFTTVIGDRYKLVYDVVLSTGSHKGSQVSILSSVPVNGEGFGDFSLKILTEPNNAYIIRDATTSGNEIEFNATGTTTYVALGVGGFKAVTDEFATYSGVKLYKADSIVDSANGFVTAGFAAGQKLRINGSKFNDSSDSSISSVGYHVVTGVSSGRLGLSSAPLSESAGNTWELIGTKPNYIDLIAGKRYYRLPDDFIKMKDVKIKNHGNGDNKYRTIPRMLHEPIDRDEDDI